MSNYKNKTFIDNLDLLINTNTKLIIFIRRLFLVLIDLIILPLSILITKFLLIENYHNYLNNSNLELKIIIPLGYVIYFLSGQYKGLAIYEGSRAVYLIVIRNAIIISLIFIVKIFTNNILISQKELLLLWIILVGLNIIVRFILRDLLIFALSYNSKNRKKIIIYGAGSGAALLASNLITSKKYIIKYFVDDNKNLWGRNINGISIKSPSELKEINKEVDEIYLAIPSLKNIEKRRILMQLKALDLPVLEIPSIDEITSGKKSINNLQPIKIEELLGRDVIISDERKLSKNFKGLSILITGAGGSIGSEICRQIISLNAKRLIMLDNSENNLYEINLEAKKISSSKIELIPILLNAGDSKEIEEIFRKYEVDIVYHAAAYKHVPIVEAFPIQGIKNNVFSTFSVCKAAREANISKLILVSTDKSVRPTNIMGASKRLAELIVLANAQEVLTQNKSPKTNFSMVRFGNVLNSSGSVVPLFLNQIAEGGPITLTHPDINRYFMTIPEAAQLVLQASILAEGGEVFLLDMGDPIRIIDLARRLIILNSLTEKTIDNPNGDIEIQIKGLRPGEKLFEEMLITDNAEPSGHPQIFKAHEEFIQARELWPEIELLKNSLNKNSIKESLDILKKLVPEWVRYNKEIKNSEI